jgi:hypothetical protein
MSDHPDLVGRLSGFLHDEAPPHAPERLIGATRQEVARTSQNRLAGFPGWRLRSVVLTPVGAVAAALLIAVIGISVVVYDTSRPSIGSAPSPVASAPLPSAPVSSPSAYACPEGQGSCLGPLQPGTYTSTSFLPAVRYTVPDGWTNTLDVRNHFDLQYSAGGEYTYPDGLTFHDAISIFRDPVAESRTSDAPEPGIGTTARDLAQWLVRHADLDATVPTAVAIGGASGLRLTLSLPIGERTAPDHCTTDHGEPRCASLFVGSDPAAGYGFGLVGPEKAVVYLVDLPSGDTVLVVIDDVDGVDQPRFAAAAMTVVESLSLGP